MPRPTKKFTKEEALRKLYKYCAYQERCHQEVNHKLYEWGFDYEERGNIIVHLMGESFLNEERFTRAFVRGKFNQKKWGKNKIIQGLKQKGIKDNLIKIALSEIDEIEYLNVLRQSISKKANLVKGKNEFLRNKKIAQFVINKGFEADIVWECLKEGK